MVQPRNDLIEKLELSLAKLANEWRKHHSNNELDAAQLTVEEYHSVFIKLWKLGWDGEGLLPDSELPDNLMPEYFLERWKKK